MNYLKVNVSIEFPMSLDSTSPLHSTSSEAPMRLGSYLIEAGLITSAQVAVVLNDQNFGHDMRFGEVLVARGWVKPETIEFVMKRVVEPERRAALARSTSRSPQAATQTPKSQAPASQTRQSRPTVPPIPAPPPRVTTPPQSIPQPIARAKSLDGDFEFEILDDITLSLPNPAPPTGVRNDRKPLPSVPDGGGVNWAG
jgi:hypothetical protein